MNHNEPGRNWGRLYTDFPDFQVGLLDDDELVAEAHAIPVPWDGTVTGLPSESALSAHPDRDVCVLATSQREPLRPVDTHPRGGGRRDPRDGPRSMVVRGTAAEWEEWTGMAFPEDGECVVPGALDTVLFEGGVGTHVEPNVWIQHRV